MLREFKEFLFRGNIVDLAVAIVVGTAFVALVNAFVADILTPIIAAIFGKPDFSGADVPHQRQHIPVRRLPERADHLRIGGRGRVLLRGEAAERPGREARSGAGRADRARVPGVPQHHPGGGTALLTLHDRGHAGDGHVALD